MPFRVHGSLGPTPIPQRFAGNTGDWVVKLPKALIELERNMGEFVRTVARDFFTKIIESSPVDTGHFRSNWNSSWGTADYTVHDGTSRDSKAALEDLMKARAGVSPYQLWILANGVPYAAVLEFGGYPNPPKRGTYVKGKGWEIRSTGGYSKQAPQGMVRIAVMEFDNTVRDAMSALRGG